MSWLSFIWGVIVGMVVLPPLLIGFLIAVEETRDWWAKRRAQ